MQTGTGMKWLSGAARLVFVSAFALTVTVAVAPATAQTGQAKPNRDFLAAYHNRNRLLLVFAPGPDDARYRQQSALLNKQQTGMTERDLLTIAIFPASGHVGPANSRLPTGDASTLRRRFHIVPAQFHVILIGKDGNAAMRADHPISAKQLFGVIDAMPMRREEMRRQRQPAG